MQKNDVLQAEKKYRYLFGPVPSRRFGRSLGIDLTPLKTCNFNCIFCQLGPTACCSTTIGELVPTRAVIEEFLDWLQQYGQADQITFAGSGEPTLHSGISEIIAQIKQSCRIPLAVLSNGAGLADARVRKALIGADIVKVSLSAWDEASFRAINRPAAGIGFTETVAGETLFRKEFNGKLLVEWFFLEGINSAPEQVARIAALAEKINPDVVQLNTCVRPPAEAMAKEVSPGKMQQIAKAFNLQTEIIGVFKSDHKSAMEGNATMILDMIRRRPCSAAQISEAFSMHPNHVAKYTGKLLAEGLVKTVNRENMVYFIANES
jgi:wyosine [tRNA(Phe)-imidazoG37] synthetase (radical SAM superfamily)